jgi:hypothetical protein
MNFPMGALQSLSRSARAAPAFAALQMNAIVGRVIVAGQS